jgi:hypothetical protein
MFIQTISIILQMSQPKTTLYVRDATIGRHYFYCGINGQSYGKELTIGKPLGILLTKTCENDSRQAGGREPTYILEFTEWTGTLEWDERLGIIEHVKCWG